MRRREACRAQLGIGGRMVMRKVLVWVGCVVLGVVTSSSSWAAEASTQPVKAATRAATEPTFAKPADVAKVVPEELYPKKASDWTELRIESCNDALAEKTHGKSATLEITVWRVGVNKEGGPDRRLIVWGKVVRLGQVPVYQWFYFDDDQKGKLTAINPGDKLTITGTMFRNFYHRREGEVALGINLEHCRVVTGKGK